jgi:hypothetical protein
MTNPWTDFFGVYVELANALRGELDHSADSATLQRLDDFLIKISEGNSQDEWHKSVVHEVIARFRGKSQAILHNSPSYFDEPLMLFPGIDGLDISKLWKEHPLYRSGLWGWIEQIYIIGNVCLHPNRKDKFLQVVRQIKALKPGSNISADAPAEDEDEEDVVGVVNGIAEMMGIGNNPLMKEMMGEVALTMQKTMKNATNPMELIQSMLNGDTSALGNLQQRMQTKMAEKIESGELTAEDLERQREGMLQQFGGLNGLLGMAKGMGLDVGPMANQAGVAAESVTPSPQTASVAPAMKAAVAAKVAKKSAGKAPVKKAPTKK